MVRSNPASVVRGPKHVIKRGKTPVLSPEEARELFNGIPTDTLIGLRDRALIGVLIYSFAMVSAAVSMRVEDYFPQGKRWWLRLHEKGGKHHEMPVHHTLEEYLDAYIDAAVIAKEPKGPLFRASNGKTGVLSDRPFDRKDAFGMVRAGAAGGLGDPFIGRPELTKWPFTTHKRTDGERDGLIVALDQAFGEFRVFSTDWGCLTAFRQCASDVENRGDLAAEV